MDSKMTFVRTLLLSHFFLKFIQADMNKTILLSLFLLFLGILNAQELIDTNLIPNAGFEHTTPGRKGTIITQALGWTSGTTGKLSTPDLFSPSNYWDANPYKNHFGRTFPLDGENYAGILIWKSLLHASEEHSQREYLATKLKDSLVAGTHYKIKFYYHYAQKSVYYCPHIGVALVRDHNFPATNSVLPFKPQMEQTISDTSNKFSWRLWEADFIADGREQYLLIGNFRPNNESEKLRMNPDEQLHYEAPKYSYIYIDNISTEPNIDQRIVGNYLPQIGKSFQLRNLHYESDSFNITKKQLPSLAQLVYIMQDYTNLKIEIQGHTDNTADKLHNRELSNKRAFYIYQFLLKKGIDKARISYKGYGASKALFSDTTEENKIKNRRVEFLVIDR